MNSCSCSGASCATAKSNGPIQVCFARAPVELTLQKLIAMSATGGAPQSQPQARIRAEEAAAATPTAARPFTGVGLDQDLAIVPRTAASGPSRAWARTRPSPRKLSIKYMPFASMEAFAVAGTFNSTAALRAGFAEQLSSCGCEPPSHFQASQHSTW